MTLKDVARVSGCSVATVSKVFKNSAEISKGTKERVLKAAKQVGYIKKATAKSATLGGQRPIVFADPYGDYSGEVISLTKIFQKYDFTLIYVAYSVSKAEELALQIGSWGVVTTESRARDIENLFIYSGDNHLLSGYLDKLSRFVPQRASRSGGEYKPKTSSSSSSNTGAPAKRQEDIWLL